MSIVNIHDKWSFCVFSRYVHVATQSKLTKSNLRSYFKECLNVPYRLLLLTLGKLFPYNYSYSPQSVIAITHIAIETTKPLIVLWDAKKNGPKDKGLDDYLFGRVADYSSLITAKTYTKLF